MPHGFETYRVFISAPGDLERDREACHDAIAEANQTTAMPANVLLVEVGLRDNEQMSGHRAIVSDNVRWSTYFIQLYEDDWGPRDLFRKLFLLATECRDDPAMPMRDIAICMKDAPGETNPEIIAFRRELEEFPNIRIFHYSAPDALKEHLRTICEGWSRDAIELARTALANSVSPAAG